MTSTVSSFFSRDALLRRQARIKRTRKNGTKPIPAKILSTQTGSLLDIIPEEDDSTPMPFSIGTTRAQRRHALNVTANELKTALDDIAEEVTSTPQDFSVTFTDVSFNFPLPPVPTPASLSRFSHKTPPSMSSSLPSSPDSQSAGLPATPTSSDDELPLLSPAFNPRRVAIQPLVINKLCRPSTLPIIDHSDEYDLEDDSEWYNREFSKILTLTSPLPPSPPPAHRDSFSIAPTLCDSPICPSPERRRRRSSGFRFSTIEAPPVPPIPAQFLSPRCAKTLSITVPRRPPPRMSIPDDACSVFSLSLYTEDLVDAEPSPLSIYSQESACKEEEGEFPAGFEVQMDCPMMLPLSLPGSPIDLEADIAHGLEELRLKENVVVESPAPVQVEVPEEFLGVGFILEEVEEEVEEKALTPQIVCTPPPPTRPPPPPALNASIRRGCSPTPSTISSFSFPPSPSPLRGEQLPADDDEARDNFDERGHGLKSKWSSSTLASVREEHASPGSKFLGASKLKMYFQGQHKRHNSGTSTPLSPRFPKESLSPTVKAKGKEKKDKRRSKRDSDVMVIGFSHGLARHSHDSYYPATPATPATPISSPRKSYDHQFPLGSPRRSYDLPNSPCRRRGQLQSYGIRRSPSQSSSTSGTSECGSEASYASGSSGWSGMSSGMGLRRKPIPVEMFLRNGV